MNVKFTFIETKNSLVSNIARLFFSNEERDNFFKSEKVIYEEIQENINIDLILNFNVNMRLDTPNKQLNYCLIEVDNKLYYYFVESIENMGINNYLVSFKQDTIQQYYSQLRESIYYKFERAFIDRIYKKEDKFYLDLTRNSLYKNVSYDYERYKKDFEYLLPYSEDTDRNVLFFKDLIPPFVYMFLDAKNDNTFKVFTPKTTESEPVEIEYKYKDYLNKTNNLAKEGIKENVSYYLPVNYSVFSCPLSNKNGYGTFICELDDSIIYKASFDAYNDFTLLNGTSFLLNLKVSAICPYLNLIDVDTTYSKNDGFIYLKRSETIRAIYTDKAFFTTPTKLLYNSNVFNYEYLLDESFKDYNSEIDIEEFKVNSDQIKYNLSLILNVNYCYSIGEEEPLKLNLSQLNKNVITYNESVNTTTTIFTIRVKNNNYDDQESEVNYVDYYLPQSFTKVIDTSLDFANDAFNNYVANNKNFMKQQTLNNVTSSISAITSSASSFAGGDVWGGASQLFNSGMNIVKDNLSRKYQLDNLKASPSSFKNGSVDLTFSLKLKKFKPYKYVEDFTDKDKEIINNFTNLYGIKVDFVDYINKYDSLRNNFVYLSGEVVLINSSLPSNLLEDIKERLKGIFIIRENKDLDFKQNYEVILNN